MMMKTNMMLMLQMVTPHPTCTTMSSEARVAADLFVSLQAPCPA